VTPSFSTLAASDATGNVCVFLREEWLEPVLPPSEVKMAQDELIGHRDFVDGTRRAVYRDDQGQYVEGNDGEKLCGWWIAPTEEEWESTPMAVLAKA